MDRHYQIPRSSVVWVIAALALATLPHVARLPVWINLLILLCVTWRVLIHLGRAAFPPRAVRVLIVVAGMVAVIAQFRAESLGLDAAVSVLVLGFLFKLLEMQYKRDIYIVLSLSFLMAMVTFIHSQTLLLTGYVLLAVLVAIGAMLTLNREEQNNAPRGTLRLASMLLLQSLPLAIVLFVLVPRVAPLWAVPVSTEGDRTGVTDEMSPGDIGRLSRSDELAFRAKFDGPVPGPEELYWRGLVLDSFDGETWRRGGRSWLQIAGGIGRPDGADFGWDERSAMIARPVDYNIILEPTRQQWLYALKLPEVSNSAVSRDRNYTLSSTRLIRQRLSYDVRSYLDNETDLVLPESLRRQSLQLPSEGNARSRALAADIRAEAGSAERTVQAVLNRFTEEPFFYTLTPSLLGEDQIDEFLFQTREGFCSHYAGAFVYLMRAAGIPARVVVGYQGAEYNPFEGYMMVYQYNAHAWAEVWLEGQGWVRVDPTAAVAPDRIRLGAEAVLRNQPGFLDDSGFSMMRFRDNQWINNLRLRLNAVDYAWNRWVVGYDEEMQFEFLRDLFGEDEGWRSALTLLGVATFTIAVIALSLLRFGDRGAQDRINRLYLQITRRLGKAGLARARGEAPADYCARIGRERPDLAEEMGELTRFYMQLRYEEPGDAEQQERCYSLFRASAARLRGLV